jgi:hypothetical protein
LYGPILIIFEKAKKLSRSSTKQIFSATKVAQLKKNGILLGQVKITRTFRSQENISLAHKGGK